MLTDFSIRKILVKLLNGLELKLVFFLFLTINVCANINNQFIIDYFTYKKVSHVVGFSCNSKEGDVCLIKEMNKIGIKQLDAKAHFLESHSWLVLADSLEDVDGIIKNATFSVSTDFSLAVMSNNKSYELYDVYNPWKIGGGRLNLSLLGTWDQTSGLRISLLGTKFTRRSNLHGLALKTAYLGSKNKPVNMTIEDYLENSEMSPVDGLSKYGFIVLKYVSEMFNFSLRSMGQVAPWEKGDVIGPMARALHNNDIDIGGSPVVMIVPRFHMAKFVYPSWPFRTCFLFRSPQHKRIKFQKILGPFTVKVWNLFGLILLLCMFFLSMTLKFENQETMFMKCSNSFLITIGAVSQQGTNCNMKQMSTRIIFFCLMVLGFLLYHHYSANAVLVNLHQPIIKINDSLNELAKTGFEVSAEPLLYFDFFIKDNKWETKSFYSQRWTNTPEKKRFVPPELGMERVRKGGFAYHTFPDVGYPYVNRFYDNRQICELTEVNLVRPTYSAMALAYNSSFVEIMKIGFAKLSEFGIRQRQVERFTAKKPHCRVDILSVSSMSINEFTPQLFVLIIGMVCALIICVIENVVFNYQRQLNRHVKVTYFSKRHD